MADQPSLNITPKNQSSHISLINSNTPINKGYLTVVMLVLLIIGSLVVGFQIDKHKQFTENITPKPTTITTSPYQTVKGVLRTNGLSEEEKQKYNLTSINYQITDFGDYQKAYQENRVMGYYLISEFLKNDMLGKCVSVTGNIPEEWKNKKESNIYNRSVLQISKIEIIDYSNCNPYAQILPTKDIAQEKLIFQGSVTHRKRPSPDIGYDYQIVLKEPFLDTYNASGSPQKIKLIDISPSTNSIWRVLQNSIDKEVTIEGTMAWGYSESRYLQINKIESDNKINNNDKISQLSSIKTICNRLQLSLPDNWKVNKIESKNTSLPNEGITYEASLNLQEYKVFNKQDQNQLDILCFQIVTKEQLSIAEAVKIALSTEKLLRFKQSTFDTVSLESNKCAHFEAWTLPSQICVDPLADCGKGSPGIKDQELYLCPKNGDSTTGSFIYAITKYYQYSTEEITLLNNVFNTIVY